MNFSIQNTVFQIPFGDNLLNRMIIKSIPRNYSVTFIQNVQNFYWITERINSYGKCAIFADSTIHKLVADLFPQYVDIMEFDAREDKKNIASVLELCNFMENNNINRGDILFVVGGGITQDIGAFACAVYKRGIPWIFIPTTLLSQTDSCVGGKTAVNHSHTKNLLGLFSAPREVIVDIHFLASLSVDAFLSGIGEMFRLCITGGNESLQIFNSNIDYIMRRHDISVLNTMAVALTIKKAIIEYDEFELDLRRSMNYGHSIGHALEALSDYEIPHGIGVAIGIMIENMFSVQNKQLSLEQCMFIHNIALKIIPSKYFYIIQHLKIDNIIQLLKNDKKAEGNILKLVTLKEIGKIIFMDLPLDKYGMRQICKSIDKVLECSI
jgi:3-dehydroquinate synthase